MKILKGDTVKVLYGKYSGKTGVVSRVLPKKNMVVVEGVNKMKRHIKATQQSQASGIIEITKPVPVAKVQLVDPKSGKPTRVRFEVKDGKKVRVAVKGGKVIDSVQKTITKDEPVKKPTKKVTGKDSKDKKASKKPTTKKSDKKTK